VTAPLPALELRRNVWRCEHRRYSRERVRLLLEEERRRLADDFEALGRGETAVLRYAPGVYREFRRERARADDAVDTERLRDALHAVLRGRELLEIMRGFAAADAALHDAADVVEQLWAAAGVARLRALPCLDVPARLLALARERLREGSYVRGGALAGACLREAAALLPRAAPHPARATELGAALDDVRALCERTRGLLDAPDPDLTGDGTLEAAAALVEGGFLVLAGRMVEELDALLAPRRRFLRELEAENRAETAGLSGLRERLSGTPPDERWDAAATLLRQARLEAALGRMRAEQQQLYDTLYATSPVPYPSTPIPGARHEQPDL
jgi:hypothetical protein